MVSPARLVARAGCRQWRCPCCGRVLGEVYGDRVLIRVGTGRTIEYSISTEVVQTCPRCSTMSMITGDDEAA